MKRQTTVMTKTCDCGSDLVEVEYANERAITMISIDNGQRRKVAPLTVTCAEGHEAEFWVTFEESLKWFPQPKEDEMKQVLARLAGLVDVGHKFLVDVTQQQRIDPEDEPYVTAVLEELEGLAKALRDWSESLP